MKALRVVGSALGVLLFSGCTTAAYQGELLPRLESKVLRNFKRLTYKGFNIRPTWADGGSDLVWQRGKKGCEPLLRSDGDGEARYQIPVGSRKAVAPVFMPGDDRLLVAAGKAAEGECEGPPGAEVTAASKPKPAVSKSLEQLNWMFDLDSKLRIYTQKLDNDRPGVDYFPVEPSGPSAFQGEPSVCKTGGQSTLVFTSDRDGPFDLYQSHFERLGTLEGVKRQTTTLLAGYNGQASFSSDCKRLVWVAVRPETLDEAKAFKKSLEFKKMQLWTSLADGAEPKMIFETDEYLASPRFTPGGNEILFTMSEAKSAQGDKSPPTRMRLFLVSLGGMGGGTAGQPQPVFFAGMADLRSEVFPAFSKNGKFLAFSLVSQDSLRADVWIAEWVQ